MGAVRYPGSDKLRHDHAAVGPRVGEYEQGAGWLMVVNMPASMAHSAGAAYAIGAARSLIVWISASWKGRPSGPSRS